MTIFAAKRHEMTIRTAESPKRTVPNCQSVPMWAEKVAVARKRARGYGDQPRLRRARHGAIGAIGSGAIGSHLMARSANGTHLIGCQWDTPNGTLAGGHEPVREHEGRLANGVAGGWKPTEDRGRRAGGGGKRCHLV